MARCEFSPATVLRAVALPLKPSRYLPAYAAGQFVDQHPQQPILRAYPNKAPTRCGISLH